MNPRKLLLGLALFSILASGTPAEAQSCDGQGCWQVCSGRWFYRYLNNQANLYDHATRYWFREITNNCDGYRCTPNTEIYTQRGWMRADQHQVGYQVLAQIAQHRGSWGYGISCGWVV